MAQVIVRHARDDFYALLTAQGMEDAGAKVFSMTVLPNGWFDIWAKYDSAMTNPDKIDESIDNAIEPPEKEATPAPPPK